MHAHPLQVLALSLLASLGCSAATGPAASGGAVGWVEARWEQYRLYVQVLGYAPCDSVWRLDVDMRPADDEPDLVVRVLGRSMPEGCAHPPVDTTIAIEYQQDYARIDIWAPYPWEPGLQLFAMTWPSVVESRRDAGGSIVMDTLPDGCWVMRTPGIYGSVRTFAYDSSYARIPIPLRRGLPAFVTGYYYLDTMKGCHGLPIFRVSFVSFGL